MSRILERVLYGAIALAVIGCGSRVLPIMLDKGRVPATSKQSCQDLVDSGMCEVHGQNTDCHVYVEVWKCGATDVAEVRLVPQAVSICTKKNSITWHLYATDSASGATFAASGIQFKASDGGVTEFELSASKPKTFTYHDKYQKADAASAVPFEYGVHIQKADKSACYDADPMVINE